jgi:hypothetical protein
MEKLLICILLLYNAWLVAYIIFGRSKKTDSSSDYKPPAKPSWREDGIVGKSHFKMEGKPPMTANEPPSTATAAEGEVITDIAATFADEKQSARLPDDKLDEAFEDIRISEVPQEYEESEDERQTTGHYASGASFEEIGGALMVADNPSATQQERKRAGQVFSDMEGNELFNKMIGSNPERARKISGLMDEILNKPVSGEGERVKVSVQPQNIAEVRVPDDISEFDIRDFV